MRMILSRHRRPVTAVTLVALVLTAACGDDGDAPTDGRPVVVATTSIWGDVVGNVACDGIADVRVLVPAGADPHAFEPSLRDREVVDGAALVVANGADLEESLVDLLATAEEDGTPVFELTSAIETLDDGGTVDPHVWQDPSRVAGAIDALAAALVDGGVDAAGVERCAAAYRTELDALDAELESSFAVVPADRRVLVTNHDALAYLADRYGFEVIGTVIPASTTLAETNAADLEALATLIEQTGVPAIFTEEEHASDEADALADRVGVEVVALRADSLGPEGDPDSTYVGLMRTNATAIVEALTP